MVANRELAVIKELRGDSRQALTEVGRKLLIPGGSLFKLVRSLKEEGIIRKYCSLVDFSRLGYSVRVNLYVSVREKEKFQEFMLAHPSVNSLSRVMGDRFLAELVFVDMLELDGFLERLWEFGVQSKDVFHVVEEFKNEGFEPVTTTFK